MITENKISFFSQIVKRSLRPSIKIESFLDFINRKKETPVAMRLPIIIITLLREKFNNHAFLGSVGIERTAINVITLSINTSRI
jgi:hypothetical protein